MTLNYLEVRRSNNELQGIAIEFSTGAKLVKLFGKDHFLLYITNEDSFKDLETFKVSMEKKKLTVSFDPLVPFELMKGCFQQLPEGTILVLRGDLTGKAASLLIQSIPIGKKFRISIAPPLADSVDDLAEILPSIDPYFHTLDIYTLNPVTLSSAIALSLQESKSLPQALPKADLKEAKKAAYLAEREDHEKDKKANTLRLNPKQESLKALQVKEMIENFARQHDLSVFLEITTLAAKAMAKNKMKKIQLDLVLAENFKIIFDPAVPIKQIARIIPKFAGKITIVITANTSEQRAIAIVEALKKSRTQLPGSCWQIYLEPPLIDSFECISQVSAYTSMGSGEKNIVLKKTNLCPELESKLILFWKHQFNNMEATEEAKQVAKKSEKQAKKEILISHAKKSREENLSKSSVPASTSESGITSNYKDIKLRLNSKNKIPNPKTCHLPPLLSDNEEPEPESQLKDKTLSTNPNSLPDISQDNEVYPPLVSDDEEDISELNPTV